MKGSGSYAKVKIAENTAMTRDQYYHGRGDENGHPVNWRPQHKRERRKSAGDE